MELLPASAGAFILQELTPSAGEASQGPIARPDY